MQHTEPTLEDVHDRVIYAFPVVDNIIVVDAGNEEDRAVIRPGLCYSLFLGFFCVPAALTSCFLLGLCNQAQKLNMAGREEVEATVDVDNGLARPCASAADELREGALFFLHRVRVGAVVAVAMAVTMAVAMATMVGRCLRGSALFGWPRGVPVPHFRAGSEAGRIRGIVLDPLLHGFASLLTFFLATGSLISSEHLLEGVYKVRFGA